MKVYVYPMDTEGCGYYRLIWPSLVLKAQGHDVKIIHPNHKNRIQGALDENDNIVSISAPNDADVMVFQRVSSKFLVKAIDIWQHNGIAVVVDLDDDMSAIHPSNPAWENLRPKTDGPLSEYDWNSAQKFADNATFVTTTSESLLKKYARHGRGVILPNFIPRATVDIERRETHNLIGWAGNVRTHPDDPMVVGTALRRLQMNGYDFRIIGPSYHANSAFSLWRDPDVTGGIPLNRWHHEIARLSVGISPLADTKFNHAKSWLKMLEYAAVGVPCVGSPRAEYRKLHAMGIGLLADSPKDWYRHVHRLLSDDALREDMSERGRQIVNQHLTIESNAWRWWEAWQTALRIQRGASLEPFRRPTVSIAGQTKRGPQTS